MGSVVKASNVFYWNSNQPDRLYQMAELCYQKAQKLEAEYSYQKAKINYQKSEEYYQKARDMYRTRKQADKAKKLAEEARVQADEARAQADGIKGQLGAASAMPYNKVFKFNPVPPLLPISPRQKPATPPAAQPRPIKKLKNEAVSKKTEAVPQPPPSQPKPTEVLIAPEKNEHRPISWRGKRHS
jgi:hypothetical protein